MNAYLIPSQRRLYPFDDAPAAWRILDRELGQLQRETLAACGLKLVDREADAQIVLSDALYFTREALQAFLDANQPGQAVARKGLYTERVLWHMPRNQQDHVPLPLWRRGGEGQVLLTLDEETFDAPMPAHMGVAPGKGLEALLTRYVFVEIETWPNLFQANVQALMALSKRAKHLPWWKGLYAFVRGGGTLHGAMRHLNKIGKNCDIHSTAVVELSEIGDNVRIGAHAVVRMCVVGAGANIDDHASVRASVIGAGASVANNNNVLMCVVYPRAFIISGPYQFSIFGAECAIMHCICCDTRLDGRTVVADVGPGKSIDSRQRYLGTCYGHGVRAGAGTITAPGRAIPNELFFLPHPDGVVAKVPQDLPRRKNLFTDGGSLTFRGRPPEVTVAIPEASPAEAPAT